jgi:exopolyphosphatase/guanosine-5'-triphosphate,3'-diphosphate pyrophosphatase
MTQDTRSVSSEDALPAQGAKHSEVIAAVDLGSNSFHMIVGELRHGQLMILDRLKETVRLAEGLSDDGVIADDARRRALDCLSQFGERLRAMRAASVRAAGTSTIRRAREDSTFMGEAEAALGHPIEVISGIEEARLIYQGVTHSLPPNDGLRLVIDIGGGSTEVILGQGATPSALESLHMGCVSMTERFFPDGRITRQRFEQARVAARLELRPVKAFFRGSREVEAIGTSGTITSTERVASSIGLQESGVLTLAIIDQLIDAVCEFDTIDQLSLRGLSVRRSQVWPGGLAILAEMVGVLGIEALAVSDGALREGLLYDLLGRLQHSDARERTVEAMAARYSVDQRQARRVAETARMLLKRCGARWSLESELAHKALDWAARLHEIGLDISHDGFQRHGAYVAEHADMPGFPRAEQRFLAFLIGSQRHQIDLQRRKELPRSWRQGALRLAILLRLAVLLNRSRRDQVSPRDVEIAVDDQSVDLKFDAAWLEANPLSVADLERERGHLDNVGYSLSFGWR